MCPSNAMYMPHMPVTSCADQATKLYQCISFILTKFNRKLDQEHWYTYILHYWHMPLNKYAYYIAHICFIALMLYSTCRPHTSSSYEN